MRMRRGDGTIRTGQFRGLKVTGQESQVQKCHRLNLGWGNGCTLSTGSHPRSPACPLLSEERTPPRPRQGAAHTEARPGHPAKGKLSFFCFQKRRKQGCDSVRTKLEDLSYIFHSSSSKHLLSTYYLRVIFQALRV